MSYISNKRFYYVNSRNRITGDDSDFTYYIDQTQENFNRACIIDCVIPLSYYLIEQNYNTFILRELSVNYVVTLTPGNYTLRSFKTVLENALNAASGNTWIYVVSSDNTVNSANTAKLYFSVSGNSGQPSFIFTTNVFEQMGFNENSTNVFSGNNLRSSNVIKLIAEDALYVHSNLVDNKDDDILQSVFSSGNSSFSNIHFTCPDVVAFSKKIVTNDSNVYRFFLTNEDSVPIQLNGSNIVFVLLLWKENIVYDQITDFIKLLTLKL